MSDSDSTIHSSCANSQVAPSCLVAYAFGLVLLFAPWICEAAATFNLEHTTPFAMHIAPGASTAYTLRITNVGDAPGIAPLYAELISINPFDPAPYTLQQSSDPRCGPLHFDDPYPGSWEYGPAFETATIAPGESLDCTLSIFRPTLSRSDVTLWWTIRDTNPPYASSSPTVFIGTLADISITSRTLNFSITPDGSAHALVELLVHNGSDVAVNSTGVGACGLPPFGIRGDFAGGCESYGPVCPDLSVGFRFPQLAVNQNYTCRLRLDSPPSYSAPLSYQLWFGETTSVGGEYLLNTNPLGSPILTLAPADSLMAAEVPADRLSYVLGIVLVMAAGVHLTRRARS